MLELVQLFGNLWAMLVGVAPESVVKALFVFASVFGLRLVNVLPTSKWARAANIGLSALLSGIITGGARPEEVAIFSMSSLLAAGAWNLLSTLYEAKAGRGKIFPAV